MSTPETDFDLDLHFLPSWAQKGADQNRYANYQGEPERREGRGDRRDRPPRRPGPGGRGPAPQGQQGPRGPRPQGGGPGGPRPERRGDDRRPGGRGEQRGGGFRGGPQRQAPPPLPQVEINAVIVPDDKGVDSLARQIKMTGRAYPLFDIAQMVLQKPERHALTFSVKKKQDGTVAQPLFVCALDDSLWLSEDEAVEHVLNKHFGTFYQAEKTQIEPPKGVYTFVAQCGVSGIILGPPNYHDYQVRLHKLHAERFSRMPFDVYKSRVKIVRDEAVVKKWQEDQSWKTEYVCLNVPEPLKLGSREEVEKHFRQVHLPNIIKQVESHQLTGTAARSVRSPGLARLARHVWEEQKRFPLQVATVLSQQFASRGLQFFKVNKTVTHVAVARPHYLDLEVTPVSEGIRKIVNFINEHPKCTRKSLVDTLAPMPAQAPAVAPAPAPEGAPTAEAPAAPAPAEPSAEATTIISDLHWLIHQGHVIEFANGVLETAKKPAPKPPKPEPQAKPAAPAPAGEAPQAAAVASASEGVAQPEASVTGSGEATPAEPTNGNAPVVPQPETSAPSGEQS